MGVVGDVPAVSMARRRIERLRGVQFAAVPWKFARKSARPPDWFCGGGRKKEAGYASWDLVRAGGETDKAILNVEGARLRRALPAPA